MPCLLPPEIGRFNVKVVSRIDGRVPSLRSDSMLFDSKTGELLAVIDTDFITTMRTGAVASLAIQTFKKNDASTFAFVGLGNTARATMLCLGTLLQGTKAEVKLLRYKNQAELFIERFKCFSNITFSIVDTIDALFSDSDVIVSCVTEERSIFHDDDKIFKPGVLIVPVHTRGFQNCDTTFDKVFCDDVAHVSGFKYFSQFRSLTEIGEVLRGEKDGRTSDSERIISYNIGLGLHDAYFCNLVYDKIKGLPEIAMIHDKEKYII
jgi:ornithine cyclodeaminase